MRLLAISGSLRAESIHADALRALQLIAAGQDEVQISRSVAQLPLFNPDDDHAGVVKEVLAFRSAVQRADAVVVCTPEYAHGIPGALKNALDWLVSSGELYGKTVGILAAAERALHVGPALREVLTTMGAHIAPGMTLSLNGIRFSPEQIAGHELYRGELQGFLRSIRIEAQANSRPPCNR